MRLLAVTVWAFVCVTLLGVLAYSMLLWSQYWRWATPRNTGVRAAAPRRRSHLSRGYSNASTGGGVLQPHRMAPLPKDKLFAKVEAYRAQLERQLRRAQWDSVRPVGAGGRPAPDRYGLRPSRRKPARFAPPDQLLARARALRMRMLTRDTEPFKRMGYSQYFPPADFYASQFNSCALVSSAGSMLGSKLGPEIDGHEAVLRFNDAPTAGFEADVGARTTARLLNSQVLARPEFDFFNSALYRNVTLVAWDPSRDRQPLDKWVEHPEFDLFPAYWLRREVLPDEPFYLLHPDSVWEAWHFLDNENPGPVLRNPPSSGFLGLLLLLKQCRHVDAYELVPSMRLTKRCHYYEVHEDLGCTLGDWHPLAAEKLLALHLASSSVHALEQAFARGTLPLSTRDGEPRGR
ncbi:beta-galactoside alpha-2,6-sialyltransferase 2-like [Dermacentor albipictus]|uniref:beta-galactoside alpha-2,6-sialyltransferase 2-like n=1 Tax=Dermacentor albipictus TaxID=60249 RepID=UPI0031FC53E1